MIACSTKAKNILQNYGNQPTKSLITFETLIEYMIEMTCHRMYCWWERVGARLIRQGRKLDNNIKIVLHPWDSDHGTCFHTTASGGWSPSKT